MCLVSYRSPLNRVAGAMSFDTFREVIDSLPDLGKVPLQGLGEPLLAPELTKMVRYATERGIRIGFNTNGTLLRGAVVGSLIEAGLSWLHISLDGATAHTYERIRRGSDFARVRRNIAGLVATKERLHSATPDITIVFVAMRNNVAELPGLVRLAHQLGVTRVWAQNLSHSFSDTDPAGEYEQIRAFTADESLWHDPDPRVLEVFDAAGMLAEDLGIELRLPSLTPEAPERRPTGTPGCWWPSKSAYITHDGKVQPCCMVMGSDRAQLGELNSASFAEVWHGDAYQELRAGLMSAIPPTICAGCALYRGVA